MMTRDYFLSCVDQRAALIADPGLDGIGDSDRATADDLIDADHLQATAAWFADQVDRDNTGRTLMPLDYPEAVLVEGSDGVTVVHRDVYEADRATVEARVGEVDNVIRGTTLLGWRP